MKFCPQILTLTPHLISCCYGISGRIWVQMPRTSDQYLSSDRVPIISHIAFQAFKMGQGMYIEKSLFLCCLYLLLVCRQRQFEFSIQKAIWASCLICDRLDFLQYVYQNSLGPQTNGDTFILHLTVYSPIHLKTYYTCLYIAF